ncbi:flagellin [Sedimentimonas flavescens]|uniref:flagellin n=1 Tax=Sedimentimonas flavescens TaxID=2851012 RepID=UPI0021A4540E|nr:flagellin [Sedimentimonas flavescens]MCT2539789.1 flagellin [Sedimentimonas flavescens]
MSSILTNSSAMVALQTLKGINSGLAKTQAEISTGKSIASAKDNAAIWAISKVMESDVKGFSGISDSLALGESTVAVARQASETITDLLTDMKGKIVAAQESNVDRGKIQNDINALKDQINSVIGAAQFNGLNLVDGSNSSVNVLSSLDRTATGVNAAHIQVDGQNLSTGGYTAKAVFSSANASTTKDVAAATLAKADTSTVSFTLDRTITYAEGDAISMRIGEQEVRYTVSAGDAAQTATEQSNRILAGLASAIDSLGIADLEITTSAADGSNDGAITLTVTDTAIDGLATDTPADVVGLDQDLNITAQFHSAGAGGLSALTGLDVTTNTGATAALGAIESLIDTATNAAANFGSIEGRIQTQSEFISNLSDAMKTGIGSLVDADMEEASARLQALQTQQQLGIQALSIANQQPQNILSLFR